jgi:hypothetical protein
MQQEEKISPEYIKGFNEGYLLAQHMPDLSEKLAGIKSDSPRMQGIRDGRQEFLIDRELSNDRPVYRQREQGKDLDKD